MRHSERTYRVGFTTYTTRHHGRNYSLHFKSRRIADKFTRILDVGIRAGIVGKYFTVEIVH